MARKRKKKKNLFGTVSLCTICGILILLIVIRNVKLWSDEQNNYMKRYKEEDFILKGVTLPNGEKIKVQLLTPNPYSRPQTEIKRINNIVIHYVGNPKTTAQNNRDYFDSLAERQDRYASSHFVVGLQGEVIQDIPLNEVAYASNNRNGDTISIEVCHNDKTGKFNKATYESVVQLTAYLCHMFGLDSKDVIRHYDVTGKLCPLYYVEHEDAWVKMKKKIQKEIDAISE